MSSYRPQHLLHLLHPPVWFLLHMSQLFPAIQTLQVVLWRWLQLNPAARYILWLTAQT